MPAQQEVLILNLTLNYDRAENAAKFLSTFWRKRRCLVQYFRCHTSTQMHLHLSDFLKRQRKKFVIVILSITRRGEWKSAFLTEDGHEIQISGFHECIHKLLPTEYQDIPKYLFYQLYEREREPQMSLIKKIFTSSAPKRSPKFSRDSAVSTKQLLNTLECYAVEPSFNYDILGMGWLIESFASVCNEKPNLTDIHHVMLLVNQKMAKIIQRQRLSQKYMSVLSSNLMESYSFTEEQEEASEDDLSFPSLALASSANECLAPARLSLPSFSFLRQRSDLRARKSVDPSVSYDRDLPLRISARSRPTHGGGVRGRSRMQAKKNVSPSASICHDTAKRLSPPSFSKFQLDEDSDSDDPDLPLTLSAMSRPAKSFKARHHTIEIEPQGLAPARLSLPSKTFLTGGQALSRSSIFGNRMKKIDAHYMYCTKMIKLFLHEMEMENLDDNEKGLLYKQLCNTLRNFDHMQLLLQTAQEGLSVLEYSQPNLTGKLHQLELYLRAAEACHAMHKGDDTLSFICSFENLEKSLPELMDPDLQEQYQTLKKQHKDLKIIVMREEMVDSELFARKIITSHGGMISTRDASIHFSENTVKDSTIIQLQTVVPELGKMDGLLPASPVLRLSPCMELTSPAEVTIHTWVRNEISPDAQAMLFYSKTDAQDWTFDQNVTLDSYGKAIFKIKKFCVYGLFIKAYLNWTFKVQSCLFANTETKKLTNRFVVSCSTCKKELVNEMSQKNFKQICSMDPTLLTKIGDEVKVEICDVRDDHEYGNLPVKAARITLSFLSGEDHELQDFPLPRCIKEIVEFTHQVTLLRDGNVEKVIKHEEDRANLDQLNAPRSYTSAGVVVGAPGTTITANRGIHVQQEFGT